ncbi:hypothetical protein ViNHUV68_31120 [Vibrio sp. NH-UV-68]
MPTWWVGLVVWCIVKAVIQNKRAGLLLLVTFLLLVAPMSALVSHIDLLSDVSPFSGMAFTLITDSAGANGFLITLTLLVAITWYLVGSRSRLIALLVHLSILLVIGFVAKTGLKPMTESPRPYTALLVHQLFIPQAEHFYKLNDAQQTHVIEQVSKQVSPWRTKHWQGEKDYSFPSGHTIFAAICLAFFGGVFIEYKRYALVIGLGAWAIMVAYSRLWLGMHRPIDLVGSILFVGLVYLLMPNIHRLIERWFTLSAFSQHKKLTR